MEPNYACRVIERSSVLANMVKYEDWKFYAIAASSGTPQYLNDKTMGTIRAYMADAKFVFCATYIQES